MDEARRLLITPVVAARRRRHVSEYRVKLARQQSATAYRLQLRGQLEAVRARALELLRAVERGHLIFGEVADGSLIGWKLRQVCSACCGRPVDEWDREPGRLQLERWALCWRVLSELGVDAPAVREVLRCVEVAR
jgi:hypothetical protein